jgi:hypothetical protein
VVGGCCPWEGMMELVSTDVDQVILVCDLLLLGGGVPAEIGGCSRSPGG